jgi:hypothetical protein
LAPCFLLLIAWIDGPMVGFQEKIMMKFVMAVTDDPAQQIVM